MRKGSDWQPKNHEALYDQCMQAWTYLNSSENRTRMGFGADTPQGTWLTAQFWPKYSAFTLAFNAWKDSATRTPVKTTVLEETERLFREVYRQLYTGFLRDSPLVTEADLVAMALPERHSGGNSPVPPPTTFVETVVTPVGPAAIAIHFRDKGSDRKAKPAGVHGAEIVWAILDTPPANWEDLVHSSFDTYTPLGMTFENDQRGKTLYFAARWENTRGDKGPWSEIQNTIIP
jgi:hypothetical protein